MLEPVAEPRSPDPSGAHVRRGSAPEAEPDALPDLLLIERSRGGDACAIEALTRRYGRRLFRVARSVLGDEERAEAAVLEAYLAAFADLNRYNPTGKFAAWLTRLTFNQARTLRAATRPAAYAAALPRAADGARAQPAGALTQPALAAADELPQRRELEQAIGRLPEVFRTVFVLRVIEGISGIETAASLTLHETTVRTRLYRALRRLGPDTVGRVRATPGLLQLTPERSERIVRGVLGARPHGSMLTISASTP
jgi:RNA polymerase sigma-70 factor, ECF subfamily